MVVESDEEGLCPCDQLVVVDTAEATQWLAPHEDVLRHREVGEERGLLEDHGDAGIAHLGRVGEADGLPVEQDVPAVLAVHPGEDLHQRGLAGTVLPHQGMGLTGVQRKPDALERADTYRRRAAPTRVLALSAPRSWTLTGLRL